MEGVQYWDETGRCHEVASIEVVQQDVADVFCILLHGACAKDETAVDVEKN